MVNRLAVTESDDKTFGVFEGFSPFSGTVYQVNDADGTVALSNQV
jgi:hypothetical protein